MKDIIENLINNDLEGAKLAAKTFVVQKARAIHESRHSSTSDLTIKDVEYWLDDGMDRVDLKVTFKISKGGKTYAPQGEGWYAMDDGDEVEILSAVTLKDSDLTNEDGEIIGEVPKGTDMFTHPFWKEKDGNEIIDEIYKHVKAGGLKDEV
jgi:hypothetical protein